MWIISYIYIANYCDEIYFRYIFTYVKGSSSNLLRLIPTFENDRKQRY